MSSLTGQKIKDTYQSLLKTDDNGLITNAFKNITDGSGSASGLYLKNNGVEVSGSLTVTGSVDITGSLTVNTINVGQNTINFIDENGATVNSLSIPSGSTNITLSTGSFQTSGSSFFSGSFVGVLEGTSSYATTASYALTASYAMNGGGGSPIDTSSFVTTSSFNDYTASQETINDNVNNDINIIYDTFATTATTGSNTFEGNQTITGSVYITGDMALYTGSFKVGAIDAEDYENFSIYWATASGDFHKIGQLNFGHNETNIVFENSETSNLNILSLQEDKTVSLKPIEAPLFTGSFTGSFIGSLSSTNIVVTGSVNISGSLVVNGFDPITAAVFNNIDISGGDFTSTIPGIYIITTGDDTATYFIRGIDAGSYTGYEWTIINTDPSNAAYFDSGFGSNTYPSDPIGTNYSKLDPGQMITCKSNGSRWIGKVM